MLLARAMISASVTPNRLAGSRRVSGDGCFFPASIMPMNEQVNSVSTSCLCESPTLYLSDLIRSPSTFWLPLVTHILSAIPMLLLV